MILYLWLAGLMWRMKVTIHPEGFSWQGPRTAYDGARWQDVSHYSVEVTSTADYHGLDEWIAHWLGRKTRWRFSTAHANTRLVLHFHDGRWVKLNSHYFLPYRMFGRIIDHIDPLILEETRLRERHGLAMEFGSMLVYSDHMRWGKKTYPYADIENWGVLDGTLRLKMKGQPDKRFRLENPYALDRWLQEKTAGSAPPRR